MPAPKDKTRVEAYLKSALAEAKAYEEQRAADRTTADELYLAKRLGKARRGFSQVVSSDCRDAVLSVLPDLLEIFAGTEEPVTIKARTTRHRDAARLHRALIKYQTQRRMPWFRILHTWIHDGLKNRNGLVQWGWDYQERWQEVEYETITAEDLAEKLWDEAEILQPGRPVLGPDGRTTALAGVKLKEKTIVKDQPFVKPIPPGSFLISPGAATIEDAPFCAVRDYPTMYQLRREGLARGYFDLDKIKPGPLASDEETAAAHAARGRDDPLAAAENDELRGRVERLVCFIQWPEYDGGLEPMIATMVNDRLVGWHPNVYGETPVCNWSPVDEPHRFEGMSIVDLTEEIQRIKTALYRAIIDWVAFKVSPQTIYERDSGVDVNSLLGAKPRSLVAVDAGKAGAVKPLDRGSLGREPWMLMEMLEGFKEQRVGVTRLNQGIEGDSLNKTARGMLSLMQKADKRIRLIARLFAENGLKPLIRKLISLNQKFVDRELVVAVSEDEDITITPDMLAGEMDLVVNVGLGNSDAAMTIGQMEQLLGILVRIGATPLGQGMITPANIYHTVRNIVEAMGRPASLFITDPETNQHEPTGPAPTDANRIGDRRPGGPGGRVPGLAGLPGVREALPGRLPGGPGERVPEPGAVG